MRAWKGVLSSSYDSESSVRSLYGRWIVVPSLESPEQGWHRRRTASRFQTAGVSWACVLLLLGQEPQLPQS